MATAEDRTRGVYGITTAAELSGLTVPTLRLYERRGLIEPSRTEGGTRRYSAEDLDLLARIGDLVSTGVNLAGVARVLTLQTTNATLNSRNEDLESENAQLRAEQETSMSARDDVPEPDRLDQLTPVDPHDGPPTNAGRLVAPFLPDRWDADPADVADQHDVIELDEDAHPHEGHGDRPDLLD